jgi:hypothetical protein
VSRSLERAPVSLLLALVLVPPIAARAAESPQIAAGRAFADRLDPAARAEALLPFDSDERFDWGYVPRSRAGVALGRMGTDTRAAAMALLAASLSERGFAKVRDVLRLEEVLFERSGRSSFRDPGRYFFALFGEPAASGAWGWRFEGHHLSLHWTVVDGRVVSAAPQFLGANPAEVRDGPHRGLRALAAEEDRARELVRSLDGRQRAAAVVSPRAPADILSGAARAARIADRRGIGWSDLGPRERDLLRALVAEHAAAQTEAVAAERMARFDAEAPEVRFAWMGGLERGEGHYYRVAGRTFLVEYDNTQDGANHVHLVWRDLVGEWGADRLAEHYRTSPHHRSGKSGTGT